MTTRAKRVTAGVAIVFIIAGVWGFASLGAVKQASTDCMVPLAQDHVSSYWQNETTTLDKVLQIIKRMTVEFNFTSTSEGTPAASSQRVSFKATEAEMDDGQVAYRLNLTGTTTSGSESETESATVWVDPSSSNILLVSSDGQNFTGVQAQQESWILEFFTQDHLLSLLNSSTVVPSKTNQTVMVNSTELRANTYTGDCSLEVYHNLVIVVGSIPNSSLQLVLSSNYTVLGNGYGSFRVLDLSLNK